MNRSDESIEFLNREAGPFPTLVSSPVPFWRIDIRFHKAIVGAIACIFPFLDRLVFSVDYSARRTWGVQKTPWKTILMSLSLCFLGTILLLVGVGLIWRHDELDEGLPFLVLSLITLTPGSYSCYILYNVYYGTPGYRFSMLPSFDDDF